MGFIQNYERDQNENYHFVYGDIKFEITEVAPKNASEVPMSSIRSIRDLDVANKKVLTRVDFNVPQDSSGAITDDTRIKAALPTIEYLLEQGATVILMSHLGRPKGKDLKYTLKPCAERLEKLLDRECIFVPDSVGEEAERAVQDARPGSLILLENVRFYPAEEEPSRDPQFAKSLAKLGDCYVNDAFGTAHRAHSSTCTLAQFFPSCNAMGLLMEKEVQFLQSALESPKRPFMAIVGGAKVSSKIGVLRSLLEKADSLFIGGAMAFTFLKAKGIAVGNSLYEEQFIGEAQNVLKLAASRKKQIYLPVDLVVTNSLKEPTSVMTIDTAAGIPDGYEGVDIGPKTRALWKQAFSEAKTLLWNGPVGVFEIPQFSEGTRAIAESLTEMKEAITIVGGGDSAAALEQLGLQSSVTHVSTGGGASLELIELGTLPGIEALKSP